MLGRRQREDGKGRWEEGGSWWEEWGRRWNQWGMVVVVGVVVQIRASWHQPGQIVQGLQLLFQGIFFVRVKLEPLPPSEERAVLEHGDGLGVKGPVGALARPCGVPGHLDEAVVEAEVVSQRVLPALCVVPVVGEPLHDELVDLGEGQHPLRGVVDGHRGQRNVRVGRLRVPVRVTRGSRHLHETAADTKLS